MFSVIVHVPPRKIWQTLYSTSTERTAFLVGHRVGHVWHVLDMWETPNESPAPDTAFVISNRAAESARIRAQPSGLDILGCAHTHPHNTPISEEDWRGVGESLGAAFMPRHAILVFYAVMNGERVTWCHYVPPRAAPLTIRISRALAAVACHPRRAVSPPARHADR